MICSWITSFWSRHPLSGLLDTLSNVEIGYGWCTFYFRAPFCFSLFIFSLFVEHFLLRVVIFYGEPLVIYRGSSFWIEVEWTSFIFPQRCLVLIPLICWRNSPLLTLLIARDVRAQNCESRSKSMILVEFLIPAYSYGCNESGFELAPHCFSAGHWGEIFSLVSNFLSPLNTGLLNFSAAV